MDVPVLHEVDLAVPRGAFVSLMGPSGSGKSTLLHLVGLLDTPTVGGVRLMGRDTRRLDADGRARARRDLVGFVFQSFHLVPSASALENVMLPMAFAGVSRHKRKKRAEALLEEVGLTDRVKHKPNELSGGQKQRVAIARALALDPPIILADEPTGNLDSKTSREVMTLFSRLHGEGRTIVQVTHDEEMARYGDRIIDIRDGRIVQERDRTGLVRRVRPTAEATDGPTTALGQVADVRLKREGVRP
ncbi:MAG: ABC transporter ATP-binding protein [Euryarchaeota archaeon]|nr:ABC transporter ATP-binding protein [Euryarchaeota archaeon]